MNPICNENCLNPMSIDEAVNSFIRDQKRRAYTIIIALPVVSALLMLVQAGFYAGDGIVLYRLALLLSYFLILLAFLYFLVRWTGCFLSGDHTHPKLAGILNSCESSMGQSRCPCGIFPSSRDLNNAVNSMIIACDAHLKSPNDAACQGECQKRFDALKELKNKFVNSKNVAKRQLNNIKRCVDIKTEAALSTLFLLCTLICPVLLVSQTVFLLSPADFFSPSAIASATSDSSSFTNNTNKQIVNIVSGKDS